LDFVHDSLESGRRIRTLNIVDDFTRECLAIEVDTSLSGVRVTRVLDAIGGVRGFPQTIVMPRRPLQTVPGVATSKCTSPSVVKFF
jgi:putative transposase